MADSKSLCQAGTEEMSVAPPQEAVLQGYLHKQVGTLENACGRVDARAPL